jgi:copper(I)-binding protein
MRRLLAALCVVSLLLPALTWARDYRLGPLRIETPWSRTPPPQAPAAAVYFTLQNTGKQADTLVSVSTPRAAEAMLHQSMESNGVASMKAADAGVALPAGATVAFKPGGLHVMLMGLKTPLKEGDRFPLTLHFAQAGKITIEITVAAAAPH